MTLESTAPFGPDQLRPGDVAPGTVVGRFVILQKLGEGATSEVYEAHDPNLDRSIALKLLRDSTSHGLRLEREAQALAKLAHPNVVAVYEVGVYGERVFLALELVRGETITAWCQSRRVEDIVAVFVQAGKGLAAAHLAGLVHRDFKPDNVIVGEDGRVRVADFGLARRPRRNTTPPEFPAVKPRRADASATVTVEAELVGTPAYAAPEAHAPGQRLDATADVYSFCCSLYAMLAGRPPFSECSSDELLPAKLRGIASHKPPRGVPRWLWTVLVQGLDPKPERRQPNLDVVVQQIETGRTRQRWLRVFAVLAGLAAASLAVWWGAQAATRRGCEQVPEALQPVWPKAAQGVARETFYGYGEAGEARWGPVDRRLLDYERSIAEQWTGACLRNRVEDTLSDPLLERTLDCLRDRRDAVAAVADVLSSADAAMVERSQDALASLPPVDDCGREKLLPFLGARMASDDTRALRTRLRKIVHRRGGADTSGALEALRELRTEVQESGGDALLAEVELELSRFSEGTVSIEEALEHVHESIVIARRSSVPLIEAQAWTQLAWLQRSFAGELDRAWASTEHAAAALATVGRHPLTEARIELERAAVESAREDYGAASQRASAVLDLLEEHPHDGVATLAHHMLAICACRTGNPDDGLANIDLALEAHRRRGTYVSQNVGALLQTRAQCLADTGKKREALAAFAQAEAALAKVLPAKHRHRVAVQLNWAVALQEQGRNQASIEHATLAVERADAGLGPAELMRALTRFVCADGYRATEQWERAAVLLREGLEFLDTHHPQHFDQSAIHRDILADVLASAGRSDEARQEYARVIEMTKDRPELSSICKEAREGWGRTVAQKDVGSAPQCPVH